MMKDIKRTEYMEVVSELGSEVDMAIIKEALLIRQVEQTFLKLFADGKLNGTVHTCVGQEFSAVAFAGQLQKSDFIFSNHRCHGHFISFTGDYRGLIAELLGKESGVCGGIGSSQHLCQGNFYSNGVQGGITPVAGGIALANKIRKNKQIGIVFIGDGTLGEGLLYETMNLLSLWQVPLLIVCENNFYAQSTPQHVNLAGEILDRAEAFGIQTFRNDTWNVPLLMKNAKESIEFVRRKGTPAFHLVETYRLNAHSKGDDDRDPKEVDKYRRIDPLGIFQEENPEEYKAILEEVNLKIEKIVEELEKEGELPIEKYWDQLPTERESSWSEVKPINKRQVELINEFFDEYMAKDDTVIFIGEDILSPYGGAFKVARNLSFNHPGQVFPTSISEAAIIGFANGLALAGMKPYAELMFGDFIALAFDQIFNHASKFYHMYNKQINCPVVIRTPMGGRRGYGPTHSQTLDKFLIGIDNITTISLNTFVNPKDIYRTIYEKERHPVVVIENKLDYGKKIGKNNPQNYKIMISDHQYPFVKVSPMISTPSATLVTYGGMADIVMDCVPELFAEADLIAEVIIPVKIHPMDYQVIIDSVRKTGKLFTIEEGKEAAGIGSEIISSVAQRLNKNFIAERIAALPVPIPSARSLEEAVLPSVDTIVKKIKKAIE